MDRLTANIEILQKLRNFFIENPDIRFFQGLQALKLQESHYFEYEEQTLILDNFHEESSKTLKKIDEQI